MAQMVIQQKLASIHPIQLENFNRDFEALLDGISDRDYGTVGLLMERYHIAPNGVLEHIVMRLMGVRVVDLHGKDRIAETTEFKPFERVE